MSDKLSNCAECGMPCAPGEYHPHAACLMFKGCHDSMMVRAGLAAIREHALAASPAPAIPAVDPVAIIEQCAALADSMAAQGYPANVIGRDIRALKAAPAISESEPELRRSIEQWRNFDPEFASHHWRLAVQSYFEDAKHDILALDAARKGEKS
ncbi:hypothetical protein [Burkholderia glumae]|uniref:hypothetical protein n=1 Tax=Burkholderia glumae TaxID=337 RepID=UPI002150FF68|nr:hypothetical protein [Burkholderia glumae]